MRNLASPRHVADVQQAVDAFLKLHKCTVVGEIADGPTDHGSNRVTCGHLVPRIRLGLLHAERDFLLVFVNEQDHHLDTIADRNQLAGMIDSASPGHLADVHQTFNPVFQLDEGTVRQHVDNFAFHAGTNRVLAADI